MSLRRAATSGKQDGHGEKGLAECLSCGKKRYAATGLLNDEICIYGRGTGDTAVTQGTWVCVVPAAVAKCVMLQSSSVLNVFF